MFIFICKYFKIVSSNHQRNKFKIGYELCLFACTTILKQYLQLTVPETDIYFLMCIFQKNWGSNHPILTNSAQPQPVNRF